MTMIEDAARDALRQEFLQQEAFGAGIVAEDTDTGLMMIQGDFDLRALSQAAARVIVEACAKVTEQFQCTMCGQWFDPSPGAGHYDEDCPKGHASWDQPDRDVAAAIRALLENANDHANT